MINIKAKNGVSTNAEITDEGGVELHPSVHQAVIRLHPENVNQAELSVYVQNVDIDAHVTKMNVFDPAVGLFKPVKVIEFEDGSSWSPNSDHIGDINKKVAEQNKIAAEAEI